MKAKKKKVTLLPHSHCPTCSALFYKFMLKCSVLKAMQKPQPPKFTSIYKKAAVHRDQIHNPSLPDTLFYGIAEVRNTSIGL